MPAPRFRSQRMNKRWDSLASVSQALTASGTSVGGSLAFTESSTVLRLIGEYGFFCTSAPTALDAAHLSFGIAVVSSDAVAAGAGSLPDPRDEAEYPWLFWAEHLFRAQSSTFADTGSDGIMMLRRHIDIRSMRKIKPRETLVWVYQYLDGGGAPPLTLFNENTRVLIAT